MKQLNYIKSRKNFGSDIPPDNLQFYIPDPKVARDCFKKNVDPRSKFLPPPIEGIKAHVGAGQNIREGYDNIDAYPNIHRADYVQTTVDKFARAETLNTLYQPNTLAEIRLHHVFEHISILDLDRTLRTWNKLLKMGGTVFLEVPDFDACVRRILALGDDARAEIFYRHIFGSQFTAGEYHRNGLTPKRLTRLLEQYGFEVTLAYTQWTFRSPNPLHMNYPFNEPLPDLTVAAKKIGEPSARAVEQWTHESYRERYPNPEISDLPTPGGTHPDEIDGYLRRREKAVQQWLEKSAADVPKGAKISALVVDENMVQWVPPAAHIHTINIGSAASSSASALEHLGAASADAVFLVGAIEYSVDPAETLRVAARALRIGGKLYVAPPVAQKNKQSPFFASPSLDWFKAVFSAVGLRLDEVQEAGGFFQDMLPLLAEGVDRLDAAGRQTHPLTNLLRLGRHYPYANWLAHEEQLLGNSPSATVFCVVGCKTDVAGGGN